MNKIKKLTNIVTNVLLCVFLVIAILSVLLTIFSYKDADGAAELFGYQMRVVTSDSMAKSEFTDVSDFEIKDIPLRSMVFVKTVPKDAEKAEQWYRSLQAWVLGFIIAHRGWRVKGRKKKGYPARGGASNGWDHAKKRISIMATKVPPGLWMAIHTSPL